MPALYVKNIYELDDISKVYPEVGCRLIRMGFDQILDNYLSKKNNSKTFYTPSLCSHLESLNGSTIDEALKTVSQAEPKLFIEGLLPWVERVVNLSKEKEEGWPYFGSDELSDGWYDSIYVVHHQLIQAFITALIGLAQTEPEAFQRIASRIAALPYLTPQQLLAHVYKAVPEMYYEDALRFLLADQRRLNLGDHEQYDSRQLIKTIYPFLSESQRVDLENYILSYTGIWRHRGLDGLRWRGLEQLYLLSSIPIESLTTPTLRYLRELERKFPGVKASEKPITGVSGMVGPPISEQAARKMSDKAWLRAMQKYEDGVQHKEFLKGGARELSSLLAHLIKENPGRFYHLISRVPDTIDEPYIGAFLNGLADSEAPSEWLFDVVRRFTQRSTHNIKRVVAWALEKRVKAGLPSDLMDLLEAYVRDTSFEMEESDRDPYFRYLNSDRGSAFKVLMRALDRQNVEEATQSKWELIEFAATHSSTSLRAGAIEELLYILHLDRQRAVTLFEKLMEGHPDLLKSHYTQEFLYYGIYKYYSRMRPLIRSLMEIDDEKCQQRGAELACIAGLSLSALSSIEDQIDAQDLAKLTLSGPAAWRRGAARIYAYNVTGESSIVATKILKKLINDEDTEVHRLVSSVFKSLRDEHLFKLREFIEAYAASRALHSSRDELAEYLQENGLLDTTWSLQIIGIILDNQNKSEEMPRSVGSEELIRLALRIYNDPTVDDIARNRAMDLFDRLMERFALQAQKVLGEWDRL